MVMASHTSCSELDVSFGVPKFPLTQQISVSEVCGGMSEERFQGQSRKWAIRITRGGVQGKLTDHKVSFTPEGRPSPSSVSAFYVYSVFGTLIHVDSITLCTLNSFLERISNGTMHVAFCGVDARAPNCYSRQLVNYSGLTCPGCICP